MQRKKENKISGLSNCPKEMYVYAGAVKPITIV